MPTKSSTFHLWSRSVANSAGLDWKPPAWTRHAGTSPRASYNLVQNHSYVSVHKKACSCSATSIATFGVPKQPFGLVPFLTFQNPAVRFHCPTHRKRNRKCFSANLHSSCSATLHSCLSGTRHTCASASLHSCDSANHLHSATLYTYVVSETRPYLCSTTLQFLCSATRLFISAILHSCFLVRIESNEAVSNSFLSNFRCLSFFNLIGIVFV